MERAASRAKTAGNNTAFAALVKDCGEENPFSKFLGPIDMHPGAHGVHGELGGGGMDDYRHHSPSHAMTRLERHV